MTTLAEKTATWPQTEATIVSSTPHSCNFAAGGGHHEQEYSISFRYEVGGRRYDGEFECHRPWQVGYKFCIRYDPATPRPTPCATTRASAGSTTSSPSPPSSPSSPTSGSATQRLGY